MPGFCADIDFNISRCHERHLGFSLRLIAIAKPKDIGPPMVTRMLMYKSNNNNNNNNNNAVSRFGLAVRR